MKKFILKFLLFILLLAATDYAVGKFVLMVENKAKSGQTLKNRKVRKNGVADILILGSSRSTHHYVPDILEDSLGNSAFVGGQDGNGIIMMYPVLRKFSERKKPALVIYDFHPPFDLYDDDPHRYLSFIRPMWGSNTGVDSVIVMVDPTERIKLISHTFRYNSTLPTLLKGLIGQPNPEDKGYVPLTEEYAGDYVPSMPVNSNYSPIKIEVFKQMINFCRCEGIRLVIVVSPTYYDYNRRDIEFIKNFAAENSTEFFDYNADTTYTGNRTYFNDYDHLNDKGAQFFTRQFITDLKKQTPEKNVP